MGWTTRNAAVSVLLAMEEHRKQAGARLAELRDARGLSQEELAHLAGLSAKTISRFENGRNDGRRETVRALAKALKVNEHDIIGPPPAPLGLGETQLDRIEAMLAALCEHFLGDAGAAGEAASVITRGFVAPHELGAAEPAPPDTERRSGAKAASAQARGPRKRRSA